MPGGRIRGSTPPTRTRTASASIWAAPPAAHDDPPPPLAGGKPEQPLIWQEDGLWCRARLDWLHDGLRVIDDYKTTEASANPDVFARTLFTMGYDVQCAFYLRGLRALRGIANLTFRFIVQESFAPYALSVIGLCPEAQEIGQRKVEYALRLWRDCVARNVWPGYPTATCYADRPPGGGARWLGRETRETYQPPPGASAIDDGSPLADQLFGKERSLTILTLTAENVKKLRAVEIT